jgi:hypothetical protein
MENPSSRNAATFTDFAIPGVNGFSLKLTRKCTSYPCAARFEINQHLSTCS